MENQSHTPGQSKGGLLEARENVLQSIRKNLNFIYIALMILANCMMSMLKIDDASIGLRHPSTVAGWILWSVQILSSTVIGVLILNSFRRQGISNGHKAIAGVYERYAAIIRSDESSSPRSLKDYMRTHVIFDSITKSLLFVILNAFVMSMVISASINSLLSLICNIVFSIAFGIKAMLDAEEFVQTELAAWYTIQIDKHANNNQEDIK